MQNNVCEVKLTYKTKVKAADRLKITRSSDAFKILIDFWDQDEIELRESFKILLVNRAGKVLGVSTISEGGVTGTVADVRLIMQTAILSNASGIILSHNHPSGNLKASDSDIAMTKKIKEAGKIMDIDVLDHLIITNDGYLSMTDEGLI